MEARIHQDRTLMPPCQAACPLHMGIREYVDLIAQGKIMEALKVIREDNPFPSICAHVCTHPCEDRCRRGMVDKPVAIRALKRFAVEFGGDRAVEVEAETRRRERVAIVGSGPAGMACAYYLRRLGYPVTIFEAHSEPGGMLRVGIPAYRLPREILEREFERLIRMGVELRLSTRVVSLELLFEMGYEAVFVTIGAHQGLRLGIEGEEGPGVVDGATFLREVNLGLRPSLGQRVGVVGGGNVAIDAARTALRLGAKEVTVLYRRGPEEMPASESEVIQAKEEGVKFEYLVAPVRIERDGGRLRVICVRMKLGEPDSSGRGRPVPVPGSEFPMDLDALIVAIGQAPQLPEDFRLRIGKGATIQVDPVSLATNRPGVFAGGDAVTGPATVVEALAVGKRGAFRIDDYLNRRYPSPEREQRPVVGDLSPETIAMIRKISRVDPPSLPPEVRVKEFVPVEMGYSWDEAVREARRCLKCGAGAEILSRDRCATCLTCLRVCPYGVPRLSGNGEVEIPPDQCQACGICVAQCPAKVIRLRKPEDRRQIEEELDHLARYGPSRPFIVGFCCRYGLYGTGVLSGLYRGAREGVWIVPVVCAGKVEEEHLLRAFGLGAEGVFVAGCGDQCSREDTALWLWRRVQRVRRTLEEMGLEPERIESLIPGEGKDPVDALKEFSQRVAGFYLASLLREEVRDDSRPAEALGGNPQPHRPL